MSEGDRERKRETERERERERERETHQSFNDSMNLIESVDNHPSKNYIHNNGSSTICITTITPLSNETHALTQRREITYHNSNSLFKQTRAKFSVSTADSAFPADSCSMAACRCVFQSCTT